MKNLSYIHAAYVIRDPEVLVSPIVFSSPHSGRNYTNEFLNSSILNEHSIRSSEDAFVDQLIDFTTELGTPLLLATVPRSFVDMNRSSEELDPALIEGVYNITKNSRVTSGLGVIPRVVSNSRSIYSGKITQEEVSRRIDNYWKPYHQALDRLLQRAQRLFGYSLLIDMHSMPHEAVSHMNKSRQSTNVVIGDRFGASADICIVNMVANAFEAHGFHVSRNIPFAGAYITQRYGRPEQCKHAVQIELDRSLYLNEANILPSENFETLKALLIDVLGDIVRKTAQHTVTGFAAE